MNSTWQSKLIVHIPTSPQLILGYIDTSINMKNHSFEFSLMSTDIIPFLAKPSSINELIMKNVLKYPKGCSFCFEGYTGVQDYYRLNDCLIDSASTANGAQLTVAIHDEFIDKPKS